MPAETPNADDPLWEPELPPDDRPIEIRLRRFVAVCAQEVTKLRASSKTFTAPQVVRHLSGWLDDAIACADGADFGPQDGSPLRYRVAYGFDRASGKWTAVIDRSQGVSCVTQAKTKEQARERIREALAAYLDDKQEAAGAELIED